MRTKTNRALRGAARTPLLAAAISAALVPVASAATTVTVRIEGARKTLYGPATVKLPSGQVSKSGASCSASSAAGALDAATHHRWAGTFSKSLGDFFVTGILGESYAGASATSFWEVLVDNVASQTGICGTKVHRGSHVLFAAVPVSGNAYPLVLIGPASARVGRAVTVTVEDYVGAKVKRAAGVTVTGKGVKATSNRRGQIQIPIVRAGKLTLHAGGKGYIRAAPLVITELP